MALPQLYPPDLHSPMYQMGHNDSRPIDILVADDEPIVRRLLEMALRSAGLRVITAANGADAVRLFHQHQEQVGLMLLDVQMPELDGPQTFAALRQVAPGVRVVFMSGGSAAYTPEDLLATGALGFVQKPFHDLDAVVHRLCNLVTSAAQAE